MKRRNAKLLLAVTAVLIPWDIRGYGNDVGWGFTFSFGKYVNTEGVLQTTPGIDIHSPVSIVVSDGGGDQFRTIAREFELLEQFGGGSQVGIYLWAVTALLALIGLIYTVYLWFSRDGDWDVTEYRAVGGLFLGAGVLFVVSRFFLYDYLLLSASDQPNWFSMPFGAVYVAVVGLVFLWWGGDLDRLGL